MAYSAMDIIYTSAFTSDVCSSLNVILKCALEQVNNTSGEHGEFRVLRSQCLLGLLFNCRMLLAIFLRGRRDNTDRTFSSKAVFSTK